MSLRPKLKINQTAYNQAIATAITEMQGDLNAKAQEELETELNELRRRTPRSSGRSAASWKGRINRRKGKNVAIVSVKNTAPGEHYIERAARGELRKGRFRSAPEGVVKPVHREAQRRVMRLLLSLARAL